MERLRFCMVTTFYPPWNFGGDGIGIQRFSRALVRRGHDVTVLLDTDAYRVLSRGNEPPAPESDEGVRIVPLRSGLGRLSLLLTQQTGRPVVHGGRIAEFLGDGTFDVINYHNISLVGGPGVLGIGRAPVKIYMAHEHWLVCESHVLWRHLREPCTGRECLRCVLHYRRPPQIWRRTGLLERELGHVDAFIAMSEYSRRMHKQFGFPRDMEVVNYFLPDLTPEELAVAPANGAGAAADDEADTPPQDRPYFLFVGRLEKLKGLDDVIPVFRETPDVDLLIAGDGEYGAVLRGIGEGIPNVKFLGRIPFENLARLYRHARALIVPSVGPETFGIILIESFRQGTPVIARRRGPFPEIVERCDGGELFETPQELVAAMRRIQQDPERRSRMAANAREGFVKHWAESAVIPKYLDVVRRAAAAKGQTDIARKLEP
ncbi:MAG TPA: glycosyltransferase family 4 protein [bacterium]|nr:glycosyltransferase family 4 protein [bacterium]